MFFFHVQKREHILSFLYSKNKNINWRNAIKDGQIKVFDYFISEKYYTKPGDQIIYKPSKHFIEPPVKKDYQILYEDDILLVINKPAPLPVHPSGAYLNNTLINLLSNKYPKVNLIHRLDIETSGVIVLAKSTISLITSSYLKAEKIYIAGVHGDFFNTICTVFPYGLLKNGLVKKKRGYLKDGKISKTFFRKIKFNSQDNQSFLFCKLYTGRTHQIRSHLNTIGYPVIGDKIYGKDEHFFIEFLKNGMTNELKKKLEMERQFLHCWKIRIKHPINNQTLCFKAPLPNELKEKIN